MLQIILNKVLSLDPSLERYLVQLEGKQLAINCNDLPSQSIYCRFDNKQVVLSSSVPSLIDVTISGTLRGFLKYAVTKQHDAITISGDGMVASLVEKLYLQLNIDWEEELSKLTGDVIAYKAVAIIRQLKQYGSNTRASVGEMLTEYLQEETDLLPTQYEVDAFMQDIDDLRLRVDRLEARIKIHESN